jgi:hypothetical protein
VGGKKSGDSETEAIVKKDGGSRVQLTNPERGKLTPASG